MHVALKWPRNRSIRDFYHSFCVFSILTCVQALLLGGVARSHARADRTQKETRFRSPFAMESLLARRLLLFRNTITPTYFNFDVPLEV